MTNVNTVVFGRDGTMAGTSSFIEEDMRGGGSSNARTTSTNKTALFKLGENMATKFYPGMSAPTLYIIQSTWAIVRGFRCMIKGFWAMIQGA